MMIDGVGSNLEMMGDNMSKCAETMQKQISSILVIIIFLKDLILPKEIKEKVKKQIDILNQLETEKN